MENASPFAALSKMAQSNQPQIRSEAQSTSGMIFGLAFVICAVIVMLMLTVKLGFVLFG